MDHDCIYSRGLPGLPQMSVAPKRFRALLQHSVKCLKRRQQMEPNPWWHNLTCCGCCTMLYTLGASWYLIQILTWLRMIKIYSEMILTWLCGYRCLLHFKLCRAVRNAQVPSSPRSGSRFWDDNSVMCRALQDPDAQADRSATEDRNSKGISY